MNRLDEAEARLKRCKNRELSPTFRAYGFSPDELLSLLDSKSNKVGDCAAMQLATPEGAQAVIDAILSRRLKRGLGRQRALFVLHLFGKSCPRAAEAYLACVADPAFGALGNALFGLVFLLEPRAEAAIQAAMRGAKGARLGEYKSALDAVRARDPWLHSSGFCDLRNVWGRGERPER